MAESDPIAVMQLEVDRATEQLKEGRRGLETYRGLVETVARQVATNKANASQLESHATHVLPSPLLATIVEVPENTANRRSSG